jgi:hypothetical protein
MRSAPLYRCYWCLQRASAKAPQKNIAPSTAANQAGGPLSGGLLKMLIAPTQSATPTPRQVNRRIYFHTIIAASKALQFTVAMRARSWVGSGQVALRIPLHSGYAASGHMVQLKRSHPGSNRGTFVVMGRKGPNVRFGSLADICGAKRHVRFAPKSGLCGAPTFRHFIRSPRQRRPAGLNFLEAPGGP